MRNKPIWLSLFAAMICAVFFAAAPAKAADDDAMKIGKKAEISLSEEARLGEVGMGELVLPAGRYRVQHQTEGADHFVRFEASSRNNPYFRTKGAVAGRPGEVKCRLEPLVEKVEQTAIYRLKEGENQRITEIRIAGENVAHLF